MIDFSFCAVHLCVENTFPQPNKNILGTYCILNARLIFVNERERRE
uniref:Uncharacterized protein n=1 Tax=Anguilla anguilla TaxID=7936 RepID=A0A0E9T707_ANGAN